MVDALRRMRRSLIRNGTLLDMQPGLADPPVLAGEGELGCLDGSPLQLQATRTDAGLVEAVRVGLFGFEGEVFFDLVHRFDTASEVVEEVASWQLHRLPPEIPELAERSSPPFEVHERCVLRRLRAL